MEPATRQETIIAILTLVLSMIGAAIAGTLWWAHRENLSLPCTGDGHGCDLVAESRWAHVSFGPLQDVPLALIGLITYLVLLTLCMILLGAESARLRQRLRRAVWLIALGGFCYSWFLQYVAHVKIGAFCVWCFSSACTMTLVFAAASWGLRKKSGLPR